jgi:hypothetical protein
MLLGLVAALIKDILPNKTLFVILKSIIIHCVMHNDLITINLRLWSSLYQKTISV